MSGLNNEGCYSLTCRPLWQQCHFFRNGVKCSSLSPFFHNKYSSWGMTMFNGISLLDSELFHWHMLLMLRMVKGSNKWKQVLNIYIYICLTLYFIYISAFIGQAILSHLRRLAKNLSVILQNKHVELGVFLRFIFWVSCWDTVLIVWSGLGKKTTCFTCFGHHKQAADVTGFPLKTRYVWIF